MTLTRQTERQRSVLITVLAAPTPTSAAENVTTPGVRDALSRRREERQMTAPHESEHGHDADNRVERSDLPRTPWKSPGSTSGSAVAKVMTLKTAVRWVRDRCDT